MHQKEILEKNYQLAFQKLVLNVSFDFMKVNEENYDKKINNLLKKLNNFLASDRTYLFIINRENKLTFSHVWNNKNSKVPNESTVEKSIDLNEFPWWKKQLNQNKSIYLINDSSYLPIKAKREQALLEKLKIKSTISVPIISKDPTQKYHYLGIDSINLTREWSEKDTELLQLLAKIIANGINQIYADHQVKYMLYHDQLTGLSNQKSLDKQIIKGIEQVNENNSFLTLLLIDLDNFKEINDSLGHQQGDILLKKFSERLLALIGEKDSISRMGGDEFVLLLVDYENKEYVDQILSDIIAILKKPFILKNHKKYITASIGVADYPQDGEGATCLIKNADIAMYHAKDSGKNQYQKMSAELKDRKKKELSLIDDLHHALEREQLEVHYQPIVQLKNEKIISLEALVRWKHPVHGYVPPSEFIPLAEQSHLIYTIGCYVRRTVTKQMKRWKKKGYKSINISINFSIYELLHPELKNNLKELIKENSLDPSYLEVEITESLVMDDLADTVIQLKEIEKLGLSLTIDDYGKGYSSLIRLRNLPVSKMKIDKLFIDGIGKNDEDEVIVNALISFAKSLNLDVVAEGVETEEQIEFLSHYKDCAIQGYYFYKPMPANEIEKLLIKANL